MTQKLTSSRVLLVLFIPSILIIFLLRIRTAPAPLPASLDCTHKIRLGDAYGGWVTCRTVRPLARHLVYTIGVGRNIEWDKAMIEKYATLHHGWDPTPTAHDFFKNTPPPDGFTFHPFGLGVVDGNVTLKLPEGNFDSYTVMEYHQKAKPGTLTSVQMLSLNSMLKSLGHSHLAILKIDIEGAEFDVINEWATVEYPIPADQVLIEFHERYFPDKRDIVKTAVAQMSDLGFQLAHQTKLEYTFARRAAMSRTR